MVLKRLVQIYVMIRYTYFEDYTLPEVGWNDYTPKMQKDVLDGKQKPNKTI